MVGWEWGGAGGGGLSDGVGFDSSLAGKDVFRIYRESVLTPPPQFSRRSDRRSCRTAEGAAAIQHRGSLRGNTLGRRLGVAFT